MPGLGWIPGTIAWARGGNFGVHFHSEIDPEIARRPVTGTYVRSPEAPPPEKRRLS
jgi:hypothetical protein